MSGKEGASPAHASGESTSIDDVPVLKDDEKAATTASDPDFEEKRELKYEDCPEKTGFAYPSWVSQLP